MHKLFKGAKTKVRALVMMATLAITTMAMTVVTFASAETDVASALGEGLQSMQGDVMKIVLVALPIGLAIFGAFFGIRKGIALLRSTSGH